MSSQPILVLGGTGKTGRRVVAALHRRGHATRPASRTSATRFDWHDHHTWEPALAGSRAAYLVPDDADDGTAMQAFTKTAVACGVQRLVLLSAREWEELAVAEARAKEEAVRTAGVEWTILRPVWFAQNFSEEPFLHADVVRGDVLLPSGDGAHPFIDAEDIAEVAAAALTEPRHAGEVYTMSGPRALTVAEAVAIISEATGRQIRHRQVSAEEYVDHLVGLGLYPRPVAEAVAGLATHIASGRDAHLSDGVPRALGRQPRDFTDYVQVTATTSAWRPSD